MMNSIAALLTEYIVKTYFQRPGASNTETVVVNEGSILPRIFPSTQFNYGVLVALFCVVVVTWMLYKTPFGFSLRAMGSNPRAMQQAVVVLPSGSDLHISISGGVAWYPEDGRDIETLKKTNAELIQTLDDVMKIQSEGREKRIAAEAEMAKMENDLKGKLLEIRGGV